MSGRFPVVTGSELVRALEKLGFVYREVDKRRTTVPVHKGVDLPGGTLRGILRDADVSPEQLREVL